jgi:Domain of unknown function (DU1801)
MYEAKTRPTSVKVSDYLNAIEDKARRADCKALDKLMRGVTKCKPKMWGSSIVGYGTYRYTYASGHSGEAAMVGFSSRKTDITIYVLIGSEAEQAILKTLGKFKTGKVCLYVKKLADIDMAGLEKLVEMSFADTLGKYECDPR